MNIVTQNDEFGTTLQTLQNTKKQNVFQIDVLLNNWGQSGEKVWNTSRSPKFVQDEYLDVFGHAFAVYKKSGLDAAENEPSEIFETWKNLEGR